MKKTGSKKITLEISRELRQHIKKDADSHGRGLRLHAKFILESASSHKETFETPLKGAWDDDHVDRSLTVHLSADAKRKLRKLAKTNGNSLHDFCLFILRKHSETI